MNKKTIYIFLDVDGVLNNWSAFMLNKKTLYVLSHENLVVYDDFIKKLEKNGYEPKVILSSTWRKDKTGINKLSKYSKKYKGLKFYAMTSCKYNDYRYKEIKRFIDIHGINVNDVIILDDEEMLDEELKQRHIKTSMNSGLRLNDVDKFMKDVLMIK